MEIYWSSAHFEGCKIWVLMSVVSNSSTSNGMDTPQHETKRQVTVLSFYRTSSSPVLPMVFLLSWVVFSQLPFPEKDFKE